MEDVVEKSAFQKFAYENRMAVVVPEVNLEEIKEGQCNDVTCRSHRLASVREVSLEYLG